jgi:hypothetical protein
MFDSSFEFRISNFSLGCSDLHSAAIRLIFLSVTTETAGY